MNSYVRQRLKPWSLDVWVIQLDPSRWIFIVTALGSTGIGAVDVVPMYFLGSDGKQRRRPRSRVVLQRSGLSSSFLGETCQTRLLLTGVVSKLEDCSTGVSDELYICDNALREKSSKLPTSQPGCGSLLQ